MADDIAAQMVREMEDAVDIDYYYGPVRERLEAIARRYMEKAVLDERENCAKICEHIGMLEYSAAIRAERAGKDGR